MITVEVDTEVLEAIDRASFPGESQNDTIKRLLTTTKRRLALLDWLTIGDPERC